MTMYPSVVITILYRIRDMSAQLSKKLVGTHIVLYVRFRRAYWKVVVLPIIGGSRNFRCTILQNMASMVQRLTMHLRYQVGVC